MKLTRKNYFNLLFIIMPLLLITMYLLQYTYKIIPTCSTPDIGREDNLKALSEEFDGTGTILYLLLEENKNHDEISHLIVCNSKKQVVDKNNIILPGRCDLGDLSINDKTSFENEYKVLGKLSVKNYIIIDEKRFVIPNRPNCNLLDRNIIYTRDFLAKHKALKEQ